MTLIELLTQTINPKLSIALFSVVVTFFSTLAQKWLTNQEHLKKVKARQKEIQKEIRNTKDPTIMQELNMEMANISMTMMKSSFKPLLVTFIPFLILFRWLRGVYIPELGNAWIWYYLGYSILASIAIRKALKVA
jgi:uncharacterized membrane protein (DUF106 family)